MTYWLTDAKAFVEFYAISLMTAWGHSTLRCGSCWPSLTLWGQAVIALDVGFLEKEVCECLPELEWRAHRQGAAKRRADRVGHMGCCHLDIGLGQAPRGTKGEQLQRIHVRPPLGNSGIRLWEVS